MVPLVGYSRWFSFLKNRHYLITKIPAYYFATVLAVDEKPTRPDPPPIRVALTESVGRGVFATRRIGAGDLIHTAKPVVAHPSLYSIDAVCNFCLKKLHSTESQGQNVAFCSQECVTNARVFYDVERKADWSAFDDYCRTQGLKYPLLVKRLACAVISGAASAEILDILQPANLSREMVLKVFFVISGLEYFQDGVLDELYSVLKNMEEGFNLLRNGFVKANVKREQMSFLTNQWYNGMLARIRINAFRIELAMGRYEDLLSSAAACVDAEASVGNAVYMLPSFYNHDCDPNAHIIWLENADARLKALRDVEADEELRICYIDASMDHNARQTLLLQGFGFRCNCLRCLSGD